MVDKRDKESCGKEEKAYKIMLQRNAYEEVSARRSEYRPWKKKVKDLVDESKKRVDEEFGRKLKFLV